MRRVILPMISALALYGCGATRADVQLKAMDDGWRSTAASSLDCLHQAYISPDLDPVRQHVPSDFRVTLATVEQFGDTGRVKPEDQPAWIKIHAAVTACSKSTMQKVTTFSPRVVPALAQSNTDGEYAFADLLNGKISYGEYWKIKKDLVDRNAPILKSETDSQKQQLLVDREQQLAQQEADKQAALNAIDIFFSVALLAASMQPMPPPNTTVFINNGSGTIRSVTTINQPGLNTIIVNH